MQLGLVFRSWGGRREGSGRKRGGNVQHRKRERQDRHVPLMVTFRARGVKGLRKIFPVLKEAIQAGNDRFGARVVHFSVQDDHFHLIVECQDAKGLSRAMKGLQIRLARAINKALGRKGRVFTDRWHGERLDSVAQARNAIRYVLQNGIKHGHVRPGRIDTCSSGQWYKWSDLKLNPTEPNPCAPARSYMLNKLCKPISIHERPKPRKSAA